MLSFTLLLLKLGLLLPDVLQAFLDVLETALGIAVTHDVDFVVGDRLLEVCLLYTLCRERTLKLKDALLEIMHDNLTVLDLLLNIKVLLLKLLDDIEILLGDIVVVLFHLTEGSFVVDHEIVDVLVLALLDLVNLNLHTQRKLLLQLFQLVLVDRDQALLVLLQLVLKDLEVLLVRLGLALDLTDVGLVIPLVVLFLVLLAVTICRLSGLMVLVLLRHDLSALSLSGLNGFLMLILVVLDLLKMRNNQCVVCLLFFLHLSVEVLNIRFELFNLFTGVLVEVVNHILLDLKSIALHFRVL